MKNNWTDFTTGQLEKYASHFVKMNFIAANCGIFVNETGSRGVAFVIKNKKDQYVDVYLSTVNIETTNYAYIPKYYWNKELRESLYVALVLFMNDREPIFYLIPSIVWRKPDKLFTDSANYSRNKPAWGINNAKNTIPELAKYEFWEKMNNSE